MGLVKLTPSPNTILHASGASVQYYGIKGAYPQADGTVTYTDDSTVSVTANVFAGNTPPFIVGDVNITGCTTDLIILKQVTNGQIRLRARFESSP